MKYEEFKELVLAAAKSHGLEEYELYYMEAESIGADVLFHELNKFSTSLEAGVCFRCICDGKMGYAATEQFTEAEAQRIVEAAMENAGSIENTESALIHKAGDLYQGAENAPEERPASAELIRLALDTQEQAYQLDNRIVDGTNSFAEFWKSTRSLCNSNGLDLSYTCSYSLDGCIAVAKDQEEMVDGDRIKAARFSELDPREVAKEAVDEAVGNIGADTVETGSYTVVFVNKMTATLLSAFFPVFSAQAAQQGLSLLKGKEGQEIASPLVTLTDDPFHPDCPIHMPFDGEGVATRCKNVIENGRLLTLLHNLATAQKDKTVSTGNGQKTSYASPVSILPYNFFMKPGEGGSTDDLLKAAGNGVFITLLNGLHAGANSVTGDFSLSAAGFLIENGKKGRPVKNFTVSGNFYELLKNIEIVGGDLEFRLPNASSRYGAPSVLIRNMTVAGK